MEKGTVTQQAADKVAAQPSVAPGHASQFAANPWFRLQRSIGNQAVLRLFHDGILQAKLASNPPGDPYEQEAEQAAQRVTRSTSTAIIQRKCACGGTCSKCAEEDEEPHTLRLQLSAISSRVQRAAKDGTAQPEAAGPESDRRGPTLGLIVEDEAPLSRPGQMKKSAFFALLEADICATADAELAAVGRSTKSCPYIEKWLSFYRGQSSAHIERALLKYAPETAEATTARDCVRDVRHRVRRAVAIWAKTGQVTGIPPGVGLTPSPSEGTERKSEEGFGTGLLRAVSGAGQAQFKEREGVTAQPIDAESVRDQLGNGRALDSHVRGRMESAFGRDFSQVRVHEDGSTGGLSAQLNARAFTIGSDIAFASGEYKPGTLVGDALIAHELAHVVQQASATSAVAPTQVGQGSHDRFEEDADQSAVAAMLSLWGRAKGVLNDITHNIQPRFQSGLRLQACGRTVKQCPIGLEWAVDGLPTGAGPVCVCVWRCLPPGIGYSASGPRSKYSSGETTMTCVPPCPTTYFKDVDKDYEIRKDDGKVIGVGAHMTPLGGESACGCLPLNIEGDVTGQQRVTAPLLPAGLEVTDVLAAGGDIAAAVKAKAARARAEPQTDPRTGTRLPDKPAPELEVKKEAEVEKEAEAKKQPEARQEAEIRKETDIKKETEVKKPPSTRPEDLMSPQQKAFADRFDAAETKARDLRNEKLLLESEQRDLVNMPAEKRFKGRRERMEAIAERLKEISIELPNAEAASKTAEKDLRDSSLSLYQKLSIAARRGPVYEGVASRAHGIDQVSGLRTKNITVDHLVSIKKISELPGFDRLSWEDQLSIINMPSNLIAMDGSANSSKGTTSWEDWAQAKDFYPDTKVRNDMVVREKAVLRDIQDKIAAAKKVK